MRWRSWPGGDREWLQANEVYVHVTQPLWVQEDADFGASVGLPFLFESISLLGEDAGRAPDFACPCMQGGVFRHCTSLGMLRVGG